jgi:hypothetical protein
MKKKSSVVLNSLNRVGLSLTLLLALAACSDDNMPSTNLSGQIVKGPVGNSTVCVYAINNGSKSSAPLTPCTTSDASGNYSFSNLSYGGDVYIEATGGTYKNEATGATTTLTTPLGSIIALSGGSAVGVVTPLTQVAVSVSTAFNSTAMAQAAANISAQAGLGNLNILSTAPAFAANNTTATNAYAAVLGALAQYTGGTATPVSLVNAMSAWAANTAGFQASLQTAMSAYAAKAGVAPTNLPLALNLAATGAVTSVSASVGTGASTVTSSGGLTTSSSLTLSGAGAGFVPLVGQGLSVTNGTTLLAVSADSGGMDVLFHDASGKEWKLSCVSQTCSGQVIVDAPGKKVTFANATLTAVTATTATGTIVVSGSTSYL